MRTTFLKLLGAVVAVCVWPGVLSCNIAKISPSGNATESRANHGATVWTIDFHSHKTGGIRTLVSNVPFRGSVVSTDADQWGRVEPAAGLAVDLDHRASIRLDGHDRVVHLEGDIVISSRGRTYINIQAGDTELECWSASVLIHKNPAGFRHITNLGGHLVWATRGGRRMELKERNMLIISNEPGLDMRPSWFPLADSAFTQIIERGLDCHSRRAVERFDALIRELAGIKGLDDSTISFLNEYNTRIRSIATGVLETMECRTDAVYRRQAARILAVLADATLLDTIKKLAADVDPEVAQTARTACNAVEAGYRFKADDAFHAMCAEVTPRAPRAAELDPNTFK